jgi:hypothetical protein
MARSAFEGESRRVAQTCIFSACLRFPEGTAARFPSVLRPVLEAGRLDSPFGSMIADIINRCLRHPPTQSKFSTLRSAKRKITRQLARTVRVLGFHAQQQV